MNYNLEQEMSDIRHELARVEMLSDMLFTNVTTYHKCNGMAGIEYDKNHNASKTALLNQITTLRNELLVLADAIKG